METDTDASTGESTRLAVRRGGFNGNWRRAEIIASVVISPGRGGSRPSVALRGDSRAH